MADHREMKSDQGPNGGFSILRWIIVPLMLGWFSWHNMEDIKRKLDEVIRCLKHGCPAVEQFEPPKHRSI